jgi:hypothetical protein
MLVSNSYPLLVVVILLAFVYVAVRFRCSPRPDRSIQLGCGLSNAVRKIVVGSLHASSGLTFSLLIVAFVLSTITEVQTWLVAAEKSACVFLVYTDASILFMGPVFAYDTNTLQSVYSLLMLSIKQPWPIFGAFTSSMISLLLSFLLPCLHVGGQTDGGGWKDWVPVAPLLLCSIMCLLVLVGASTEVYRTVAVRKAPCVSPQLSIILVVSVVESIAFFVLFCLSPRCKLSWKDMLAVYHDSFFGSHFADLLTGNLVREGSFDLQVRSIHGHI